MRIESLLHELWNCVRGTENEAYFNVQKKIQ